jgi:NADH-quinone oxidoreductase subunit M
MFSESRRAAVLGGTGMILGACYLLWMIRNVVFGPLREPAADHEHAERGNDHGAVRPVGWHEIAGLAPLMALIVLIGVVPGPFLDRIRPTSGEIDKNLQSQRGSRQVAVATTTIPQRTIIAAPRNAPKAPQGKRR